MDNPRYFDIATYVGLSLYVITLLYGLAAWNYHIAPMVITAYLVVLIAIYRVITYIIFKKASGLMGIIVSGKRALWATVWSTIAHLFIAAILVFLYHGM